MFLTGTADKSPELLVTVKYSDYEESWSTPNYPTFDDTWCCFTSTLGSEVHIYAQSTLYIEVTEIEDD